jgi:hypothetical protein
MEPMTWTYDSGLPSPMRTLVRNAVIAKLQPLTRAGGGWLEAVIPIGFSIKGPHDELGIDLLWSELGGRAPAIAVATTSLKPDDGGAPDTSRGHLTFELYLVSSHRRGLTDGRTPGDAAAAASNAADPGLDAALELAWMYLLGVDLGIGPQVADPRFVEEDEIVADNDKTIWQQTWRVWLTRDVDQLRASLQKLTGLRTTLSPGGDEPVARHLVVDSGV